MLQVGMERMSQTVSRAAGLVSEALSWGLDIASWRAHLNGLTWPEILRQLALTAGWGPRRCRPARAARAYDDRRLGEDVVEGEDGTLTFVWPSRFQPSPAPGEHTMKEACWKVLADMAKTEAEVATAAAGLPVREIARRIDVAQLRNNKSTVIVEGSVAGALSRDSLFAYVAPGTYALQVGVLRDCPSAFCTPGAGVWCRLCGSLLLFKVTPCTFSQRRSRPFWLLWTPLSLPACLNAEAERAWCAAGGCGILAEAQGSSGQEGTGGGAPRG